MKKFTNFLIQVTIFFPSYIFFKYPFELYAYYLVMLFLGPIWVFKYGFSKRLLVILMFLLVAGVFQILIGNNTTSGFMKTYLGVFLAYSFFYLAIKHFNFNIKEVMRIYFRGAVVIAGLGIFQELSYLVKFTPGYDYSWILNKWGLSYLSNSEKALIRVNAIICEPSGYAMTLAPALFLVMASLLLRKEIFPIRLLEKLILITGFFLSFSSSGYAAFAFIILIIVMNYLRPLMVIMFTVISYFVFTLLYNFDQGFQARFDSVFDLMSQGTGTFIDEKGNIDADIAGSSFVWYDNMNVAFNSAIRNPLTGGGLGSHPVSFAKYSSFRFLSESYDVTNDQDANSQFNRILSECGFLGIILVFLFLVSFFVKRRKNREDEFWIISGACIVIILSYLFRYGHYFIGGYPLFVWGYYINYRNYKSKYMPALTEGEDATA